MALTVTSTSAAVGASDLTIPITSTSSGFPAVLAMGLRQVMQIDGEQMLIDYVPVANTVKVMMRGYNGTTVAAHEILAPVLTSSTPSDFLDVPVGAVNQKPPYVDDFLTIGVNTTFTAAGTAPTATTLPLPIKNTTYYITKATAAAITLISGTGGQAGVKMTFYWTVAAANTVTYTPGFNGDTTSSDVATGAALVGTTLVLQCGPSGLWAVVGQNGVTLA
jgi:hypothetical protein